MNPEPASQPLYAAEVDARDLGYRCDPGKSVTAAAGAATRGLGLDGRVEVTGVNDFTGSPAAFRAETAASRASPVVRALSLVQRVTGKLARTGETLEWLPDPRVYRTSAGTEIVHVLQVCHGVPCFEGMRTVRLTRHSRSTLVAGDHAPMFERPPSKPELDAAGAALTAARYLADRLPPLQLTVTGYAPRILATHPLPAEPTYLHKRPFEDPVLAHLTYFYLGRTVRLGWFIELVLPDLAGTWNLIVDAHGGEAGRVLWCRETSSTARDARGLVFGNDPDDPTTPRARRDVDFPIPLDRQPPLRPRDPLLSEFPQPWVTDRRTRGNNVRATRFGDGALTGALEDGRVVFAPADDAGDDQRLLNAFYYCNQLHDLFYLLGFDEASGNFQERNFTGSGRPSDPLEVRIVDLVPRGDARFDVRADGGSPRVAFGEARSGRHTALSADVVLHEVTHGLTDRLVGGRDVPHPMQQGLQSRALDEGICDWLALTVQHHAGLAEAPPEAERLVFGAWVAGDADRGLRPRSYRGYPLGFGDLSSPALAEPHAAGQVWCAALLAMNRKLGEVVGDPRQGHEIGWQLMVDGLKGMSKTPLSVTYLAARDRIYEALADMARASPPRADGSRLLPAGLEADVERAVRSAFAERGMGEEARADGPGFANVVADPPASR